MAQPTTLPVSENIVANLVTTLEGIKTTDPTTAYWYTVRNVMRHGTSYPTINSYPACVVSIGSKSIRDDISSNIHSVNDEELHVSIDAWMTIARDALLELQKLERDVRTALMLDPTRGTAAIHTSIERVDYAYQLEGSQKHALVSVDLTIQYRTRTDSLETSV